MRSPLVAGLARRCSDELQRGDSHRRCAMGRNRLMAEHVEAAAAGAGRMIVGRLHPGSDLVRGLERACDEHGVAFAAVLSCYGSLSAAGFKFLQIPEGESHPRLMPHRVEKR